MTPSEIFKDFSDQFLRSLADEVAAQEASVVVRDSPALSEAVKILLVRAKVADERTAERLVVSCTKNEAFARWISSASHPPALPSAAASESS